MKLIIALTLILALGSALECGDGEYVKLVVTKAACYTGCDVCTATTGITGGVTCTSCSDGYVEKPGAVPATDP